MNNIYITNSAHPLSKIVQDSEVHHVHISYVEQLNLELLKNADRIIDLTLFADEEKLDLIEKLSEINKPLISDLTCQWAEGFLQQFDHLKGAVSLAFHQGDKKAFEYYLKDELLADSIEDISKLLESEAISVVNAGCGFQFARTLVMLINEAFFAYEQGVATKDAIDQAMCYGVNYPKGLFEWSEKIGKEWIVLLLDNLHHLTGDARYRVSVKLRAESIT